MKPHDHLIDLPMQRTQHKVHKKHKVWHAFFDSLFVRNEQCDAMYRNGGAAVVPRAAAPVAVPAI